MECVARNVPVRAWRACVFDKLEADLAQGDDVASGQQGVRGWFRIRRNVYLTGSQHNDPFYNDGGRIRTRTNNSGGIQGGISNGENIVVRVGFKPTATIMKEQETVDVDGQSRRR